MGQFSTLAVFFIAFLGTMSYAVGTAAVQPKTKVLQAVKDATLGMGQHGYCPGTPVKCDYSIENCRFCNQGKKDTLVVSAYVYPASALIGFSLGSIPRQAKVLSCKLQLPGLPISDSRSVRGPCIRVRDTAYDWDERKVTYNTRPKVTPGGSYGIIDPWRNPAVDVTRGCKRSVSSGSGFSVLLEVDTTRTPGIEIPDFGYPSREGGRPARLTITYVL